jgi:hypothetical protein
MFILLLLLVLLGWSNKGGGDGQVCSTHTMRNIYESRILAGKTSTSKLKEYAGWKMDRKDMGHGTVINLAQETDTHKILYNKT